MPQGPRVLVVGACFTDLCFYTADFPRPGQTVAGQFAAGLGGKGSNQAICMELLHPGLACLVSAVGRDAFGDAFRRRYAELGAAHHFVESGLPTGCAGIYVDGAGRNEIVIAQGAVADLTLANVRGALRGLLGACEYVVAQCEQDYASLLEILRYVRAERPEARVVLNPAPYRACYDYAELLGCVDILVPNEIEHEQLVGRLGALPGHLRVVTTLGERGVRLSDGTEVPAERVAAVDTTGAGDCWIGAFVARLCENGGLEAEAARFANRAAALSVTRRGTSASYPARRELPG